MFIRIEIGGHYFELGRITDPELEPGPPDNAPQPMQVYVEPIGFRLLGQDGQITVD